MKISHKLDHVRYYKGNSDLLISQNQPRKDTDCKYDNKYNKKKKIKG